MPAPVGNQTPVLLPVAIGVEVFSVATPCSVVVGLQRSPRPKYSPA